MILACISLFLHSDLPDKLALVEALTAIFSRASGAVLFYFKATVLPRMRYSHPGRAKIGRSTGSKVV